MPPLKKRYRGLRDQSNKPLRTRQDPAARPPRRPFVRPRDEPTKIIGDLDIIPLRGCGKVVHHPPYERRTRKRPTEPEDEAEDDDDDDDDDEYEDEVVDDDTSHGGNDLGMDSVFDHSIEQVRTQPLAGRYEETPPHFSNFLSHPPSSSAVTPDVRARTTRDNTVARRTKEDDEEKFRHTYFKRGRLHEYESDEMALVFTHCAEQLRGERIPDSEMIQVHNIFKANRWGGGKLLTLDDTDGMLHLLEPVRLLLCGGDADKNDLRRFIIDFLSWFRGESGVYEFLRDLPRDR